jgi:4-amino-4-deoxy-L-arabinose transferase-like glycosyltransferase
VVSAAVVAAVWLFTAGRSLWFDELFAVYAALRWWPELLRFVRDHDAHPPAYPLLLQAWAGLFGSSERAVRALSGVLGVGTLAAVRALARERLGSQAAALAVSALAASPLFLQASAEATRYALLTFLYVWAAREAVRARWESSGLPWRLAVLGALLLYTHYLGAVLAASLAVFALWEARWKGLARVGGALAAAAVAYAAWLPVLWHHVAAGRFDPPWRPALPPLLPLQVLHVVGFGGRVAGTASYFSLSSAPPAVELALGAPVVGLVGLGLWSLWIHVPTLGRLVACCAGLPAAALFAASVVRGSMVAYPRYFVFTLPFLALAVGSLAGGRLPRAAQVAAGLCGLAVLGLAVGSVGLWAGNLTQGMGDRRALAAQLRAKLAEGDAVLVYPRWELVGLEYYLPELRGRYVALPSEWTEAAVEALRAQVRKQAASARVWVVQGFPVAPGAFEGIYRQLARTHRVAYFGEFDGLRLTLFVRRTGGP